MNREQDAARGTSRMAVILGLAAITLIPVAAHSQQRSRRDVVKSAMPGSVFIMAADFIDGKLTPIASGSGTILTPDGSILTNHHVINNKQESRLFHAFLIGRFRKADQDPELVCAGTPTSGKLKPNLDLALIKCSVDLEGNPFRANDWPTIPVGDSHELIPGEEIIVIGYPGVGGSTIHVTSGKVSGWRGERGGAGRAYIKTDAHISHGNSGGTAINADGLLVGVPTAFFATTTKLNNETVTAGKVGLIRPVEHAMDLVRIARAGFAPQDGNNSVVDPGGSTPTQPRDPPPQTGGNGVSVASRVLDAGNGDGIRGATVAVFKAGFRKGNIDFDRVEEQVLTFGQTNSRGEFVLNDKVPRGGSYTVAVVADGYNPLIEDDVLVVDDTTPSQYDPWGEIMLERR